ncbi:cytochrome P450 [Tsuneonella sp. CC-YZS046]|uniref:cytochrome P450 n=1 Tax=Tsuneonella sp. CC-YZS046 TaxID=3042152 RepID=UPI002D78F5AD|nr:cytochrome P450 [Tsuneonella sp. CC-YZS046]WRO66658.1 cytochrome P450 [Tsuneonella sp. CC-YZS046]
MTIDSLAERPSHVAIEQTVDFDFFEPPGVERDFQASWRTLQEPGVPDVVWTPYNGGHWIATRGDLVQEVFSDYEKFSNRVVTIPKERGEHYRMLPTTLDPPEHRPVRSLLNRNLSPAAVNRQIEMIRSICIELIEEVKPRGRCDLLKDFAAHFPIRVFMHMVNLPREDAPKMKYWTDQVVHPDGSMTLEEVMQSFHDYLEPVVRERQGKGGEDVLSDIVNAEIKGRQLTMEEMLNLLMQFMMGGLDTVYNLLAYSFLFLARNPGHRQQLLDDPELIPGAVNELLRRFPLVSMAREVRNDIEWHGASLKKGDMIICASPLVGNDERLNPDPMNVDFRRKRGHHATFGMGQHICPGAHLARVEMRITLAEWLARIPHFDVAPDTDIVMRGGIVGSMDSLPLIWAA